LRDLDQRRDFWQWTRSTCKAKRKDARTTSLINLEQQVPELQGLRSRPFIIYCRNRQYWITA